MDSDALDHRGAVVMIDFPGVAPEPEPVHGRVGIAVIEDNRLLREGLTLLLDKVPGFQVVAGGPSADLESLRAANPDLVLLDLGLRDGVSLRVAERLRSELPHARVVVMDLLPVQEEIIDFVHVGVAGFVMKDATMEELVHTIRSVMDGAQVLPPQATGSLFAQIARVAVTNGNAKALRSARMTPREREVIGLISQGLGNKQIAARLHIATHTVKSHVRNIMEKLALHTRLQIAAHAREDPSE